jgi:hypothetical protein
MLPSIRGAPNRRKARAPVYREFRFPVERIVAAEREAKRGANSTKSGLFRIRTIRGNARPDNNFAARARSSS